MKAFNADLHIHSVLSPCGDLEMSPANIVLAARVKKIGIIGITDHNSTRHCRLISKLAARHGIHVLCGAEITSAEEVHCLAFMPDFERLDQLQIYLDRHLPGIRNNPEKFGEQVQVDEHEMIVYEEKRLLISAIDQGIAQIEQFVRRLGGLFIPAHIDRPAYGLISQLGFVPEDLQFDALELSKHTTVQAFLKQHPSLAGATFIQNSDAHYPVDIGESQSIFKIEKPSFEEIRDALHQKKGRRVN